MGDCRVLCAVFDKKAETFGELVSFDSEQAAVRAFGDVLADTRTMIGRHPEDYKLVKLGEFDHLGGVVSGCDAFLLCDGFSFQREDTKRNER